MMKLYPQYFFLWVIPVMLVTGSCSLFENEQKNLAPYPCVDGSALDYACENVDLFAHLSLYELTGDSVGTRLNDIWGWTDPETNHEYALVGYNTGVAFVDITDPEHPEVAARLPEADLSHKYKRLSLANYPACNVGIGSSSLVGEISEGSVWRDVKVYDNHAFVVSDAQPHGMQVVDLTQLRNYDGETLMLEHDALYTRFGNAHNIVINEETGFAYATGVTQAEVCGDFDKSGLHMINIQNPKQPEFAGCYIDEETDAPSTPNVAAGYIHDAQCVIYEGPDSKYSGQEICFNSAEGNVVITDVTDKSSPQTIAFNSVPDMYYSHQGWLTEDQDYFLMNDENDERNLGRGTKTYVWDVRNLEQPEFVGYYTHQSQSIDHNLYVKGRYLYEANYNAGLQILDLSGVAQAEMERVAYFDTQPETDATEFEGTWSNYPYFESGMVVISDIEEGLFIVRPNLD